MAGFFQGGLPLGDAFGGGFGAHVGVGEFFFFALDVDEAFLDFFLEAGPFFLGVEKAFQGHVEFADGCGEEGGAGRSGGDEVDLCGVEEGGEGGEGVAEGFGGGCGRQEVEADFLVVGDLVFAAEGAGGVNGGVDVGSEADVGRVEFWEEKFGLCGGGPGGGLDGARAVAECGPDFFGDEGAVGVEEAQDAREAVVEGGEGAAGQRGVGAGGEGGFGGFDVAGAEVVPGVGVEVLGGSGELVVVQGGVGVGDEGVEFVEDVLGEGGEGVCGGVGGGVNGAVVGAEAGGVPEFVAEVAAFFDLFFVVADVLALGGDAQEAEAEAVGAVFFDEVEGVGGVAQGFGEFAALGVANEAGEVNVFEGDVAGGVVGAGGFEFEAGDDHAGNPEEDDVGAGDEDGGGVEFLPRRLVHGGVGPEPGGGPGVEAVGVLCPAFAGGVELAEGVAVAIPDGDAVAPDDLTREAPVLDVFEPVGVNFFPAGGVEADEAFAHDVQGGGDHVATEHFFVVEEPLFGEAGFDGDLAAFGVADGVLVGFLFDQEAEGGKHFGGFLAGLEAVEAVEFWDGGAVDAAVGGEYVDDGEVVAQADVEVGAVVGGGDFEGACAEGVVNVAVGDDGDFFAGEGAPEVFADEVGVAGVGGVNGDGGVAHEGFGTGGGDFYELAGVFGDFVAHGVEGAVLGCGDDFFVGDGGEAGRAPVDHAFAAVDVAAVVEVDEGLLDGAGVVLVHGEAFAPPVAGAAEFFELLNDDAAAVVRPCPDEVKKVFAWDVVFGEWDAGFVGGSVPKVGFGGEAVADGGGECVGFAEGFFDGGLCGEAGVVGAGKPEDFEAL